MKNPTLYYGKDWGGTIEVTHILTRSGRLLMNCRPDNGREFCITVGRWVSECRAGAIVEIGGGA